MILLILIGLISFGDSIEDRNRVKIRSANNNGAQFFQHLGTDEVTNTESSDYEYIPDKSYKTSDNLDMEPIIPESIDNFDEAMHISVDKSLDCDDFKGFNYNFTMNSVSMYNSSRRSPPNPWKLLDWCRSLKYVTRRAVDWNSECKDSTVEHFNIETLKGHLYVIENICDDQSFLDRYNGDLNNCIVVISGEWEICYVDFKNTASNQKNTTHEWTHFETHFYLCCARAQFRRCTLDSLHRHRKFCTRDQALTLQKFSVIISEGEVHQDCEFNVQYKNCPTGDPRPSGQMLYHLMSSEAFNSCCRFRNQAVPICILVVCFRIILLLYVLFAFFLYQ